MVFFLVCHYIYENVSIWRYIHNIDYIKVENVQINFYYYNGSMVFQVVCNTYVYGVKCQNSITTIYWLTSRSKWEQFFFYLVVGFPD